MVIEISEEKVRLQNRAIVLLVMKGSKQVSHKKVIRVKGDVFGAVILDTYHWTARIKIEFLLVSGIERLVMNSLEISAKIMLVLVVMCMKRMRMKMYQFEAK